MFDPFLFLKTWVNVRSCTSAKNICFIVLRYLLVEALYDIFLLSFFGFLATKLLFLITLFSKLMLPRLQSERERQN